MFCMYCGNELSDNALFCKKCGKKIGIPFSPKPEVTENELDKICAQHEQKKSRFEFIIPEGRDFYYTPGDYAYVRLYRINEENDYCSFYAIDNISRFGVPRTILSKYTSKEIKVGEYYWVIFSELINSEKYQYKVKFVSEMNSLFINEVKTFAAKHRTGEIIYAPITEVKADYISIHIGPNATYRILENTDKHKIKTKMVKVGDIGKFSISKCEEKDNKVFLEFQMVEEYAEKDVNAWKRLPKTMKEVIIPDKIMSILSELPSVVQNIEKEMEEELTAQSFRAFVTRKYSEAYASKRVNIQIRKDIVYMDFLLGIYDEKGVPQSACFKKKDNDKWVMNLVGFASAERLFESYVYISDWKQLLDELSDMALSGEEWDYETEQGKGEKYILRQYLLFDFYKSWLDNLIIEENGEALFNTGLVDSAYDDIYCYLKRNTYTKDFFERKWEFGYFACRGKNSNGKALNRKFGKFPSAPCYVDQDKIEDIYFNPDKDLSCDYEHIIRDNSRRLPMEYIKSRLCWNSEIMQLFNQYEQKQSPEIFEKIHKMITDKNPRSIEFRRLLQDGLKDAIATAKKYCKWNYKTAIPIYYPRNNGISLLLPLKLRTGSNRAADVALVVEPLVNGNYQGQTILTLSMAYQDARQICRPNSEWLTLGNVREDNRIIDTDDEEKMVEVTVEPDVSIQKESEDQTELIGVAGFNEDNVIDYLRGIITTEWVNVASVGCAISKQFPDFNVKKSGYKNVTDFLNRSGVFITKIMKKNGSPAGIALVRRK
ncbi:MAG: DUF3825 domain-containing protein [Lachnospiraceae bacterium]